jgi:large subunit ribosomal protein L5
MKSVKELEKQIFEGLKEEFGYTNLMQAPRLVKVVLSAGVGSFKDKKRNEIVQDRLTKISGQKPVVRGAKKSIASFKTREGDVVGYQVTLRGGRMYGFLDKLLNAALPRTKDFRGISKDAVDNMGNITIGIREHTIFPETSDEELKDVFGFGLTIVTTAKSKEEAVKALTILGVPFGKR